MRLFIVFYKPLKQQRKVANTAFVKAIKVMLQFSRWIMQFAVNYGKIKIMLEEGMSEIGKRTFI